MAFTFCENCGEKIDIQDNVCPHCGYKRGGEYVPPERERSYSYSEEKGDEQLWKNPSNNGTPYGTPQGGMYTPPHGNAPYGQYPPFAQRRVRIKRPISKGLAVFSAINLFLGMLCTVGLIFGALALGQTISAQSAINEAEEVNKKKTALALNIIGLSLTVINIVALIVGFIIAGGAAAVNLALVNLLI